MTSYFRPFHFSGRTNKPQSRPHKQAEDPLMWRNWWVAQLLLNQAPSGPFPEHRVLPAWHQRLSRFWADLGWSNSRPGLGAPSPFWTSQAEIGPKCGQGLKTETWASQNVICLVIPFCWYTWLAVWPQIHFLCQSPHRAPGTFAESLHTYLHFQMVFHARPKVQLSFWTSVASMKTTQRAAGFLFNTKKTFNYFVTNTFYLLQCTICFDQWRHCSNPLGLFWAQFPKLFHMTAGVICIE